MLNNQFLIYVIILYFSISNVRPIVAASSVKIENGCSCVLLTCSCCQTLGLTDVNLQKTVCMDYKLSILPVKVDIKIKVDNKVIYEFEINPKNPPNQCIPLLLPDNVMVCLKLHDIKMLNLTGIQICATLYVKQQSAQIITQTLPCMKLSTEGIDIM